MPQFVASLRALQLRDLPALSKPLRPYWVTQDSTLASQGHEIYESFRPVICLTASRRVTAASEVDSNGYIQGAADDTENWARGLAPPVFWANADLLLATPESELPDLIYTLTAQQQQQVDVDAATVVQLTSCLSVCALPLPLPLLQGAAGCCCVSLTTDSTPRDQWIKSTTAMEVGLGKHKTASRNLRTALPHLCDFVAGYLRENLQGRVTIACESGKDTSVGTALALSCYLFDDEGRFREPLDKTSFTKTLVKMRLGAIMTAYPGGNPSRQTLQSVNSFLMDWTK
jgi:tRNA A64-2'-O-ribosylphosphate transferase